MNGLKSVTGSELIALPRVYQGCGVRYVSITGGKGGVGKTAIAVNLAIAFRQLGGRVLLLDGDLGLANADQLLRVNAQFTLFDVVQSRASMDEAVVETPWGIDLMPAASGRQEMVNLNSGSLSKLLQGVKDLSSRYDYIVIDTAAGIGDTAMELAAKGDLVLGITTPDPTSVRDIFSVMKVLSSEYSVKNIELVTNMVGGRKEGLDLYRRISSVAGKFLSLKLGLAGYIEKDLCVSRSVMERIPLVVSYPGASATSQVNELAKAIVRLNREAEMEKEMFPDSGC